MLPNNACQSSIKHALFTSQCLLIIGLIRKEPCVFFVCYNNLLSLPRVLFVFNMSNVCENATKETMFGAVPTAIIIAKSVQMIIIDMFVHLLRLVTYKNLTIGKLSNN